MTSGYPLREGRKRHVSMADVARRAGVSAQTVSRVSNGYQGVVPQTRELVLKAMDELGYRPNSAARALKLGSFHTIGVITFSLETLGNHRTIQAISAAAAGAGYAVTLIPVDLPTHGGVEHAFGRLGELAVDAVAVIVEVHLLDRAKVVLPRGVPTVVVDSDAGDAYTVVDTDQADGARQATRHLLELGHRSVRHLAGPESSYAAQRRVDGWRDTLLEAGCEAKEVVRGDWSAESGYEAGRILVADTECTAVFCANDQMALGLYRAAAEAGRRIPEDLSVVGFDDSADTPAYSPPLTTIHQDFAEVGRRSVAAILEQLRTGEQKPGTSIVPTRFVQRASTAAPRAGS
ncbi:LacI family DNA-binding transcriptional regulator [Glutamicibacter sp. FBE19]|uniref:LacI family DNA-binding transcriptional regulator n=1 Tax=Glutamicibacter sp. FBE19 TaxID=2761534 RepID=UPI001FD1A0D8|nr:LacI family DNA-binding transcriptional regulator [Glutamicibacter sp. FBE19]